MNAIEVENLSKKYVLRHEQQERYTALRDVMANSARRWGKKILSPFQQNGDRNNKEEFWALKDVSFEIKQGDRVGIIGRNGAGKSTLLKILSRITEPTTGRARIKGRVASLLEVGTGFHPELTGRENIYLNGTILGMTNAEVKKKFDEIVAFSEVEKFLDTPVKRYSSGMYVRLAFSVAAHLESEVLIIDEVLAVGDSPFQKKCINKMSEISKDGRTILFVSHNMGVISAFCNRTILMKSGQLIDFDNTQKVISVYNNIYDKQEVKELDPSMRIRGNGLIELKRCRVTDDSMASKNSFLINEDISVEVEFESHYEGDISFWLIILDAAGTPVLSSFQKDRGLIRISKGYYKMIYKATDFGLLPGNYTISIGAFDAKLNFLEWIDGCQTLEVLPCFLSGLPYDGRWGQVNQKAEWYLQQM